MRQLWWDLAHLSHKWHRCHPSSALKICLCPSSFVPFFGSWSVSRDPRTQTEKKPNTPLGGRIEVKSMDARSISAIWLVITETWHVCLELTCVTLLWFCAICITDAANLHPSNIICCFTFVFFFFSPVQIRPYVGCLVQYLPLLWKQSEEHNMLRCAILTTLIHLVQVWRDPCRR